MVVFFVFFATAASGIFRYLDETPIVATFHMTFAFSMLMIIFFHLSNNWKQLMKYLANDKKELGAAIGVLLAISATAYLIHNFSLGEVV
jgi:hypothetical protein